MFGCLPKIQWYFLLRLHDCLKPPDEQMFRCFQHWLIRCFAQSIWLFKTCRWTDVWMFTNDSMRFSTQITWLFKTSRWTDVWMFYSTLFLLRSNAYLKLTDEQMFGCLTKIKLDFLLRSHDCLKPPDEQMFGCFTKHYFYSDPMPI